ncbi:hypothetical protein BD289DRAFT_280731 [Coniella lustricola]|uniref:Uncharacterized protein n=1 Tax=Coniella lustricola TaxID=2025994 RepID=A0A2T3A660_9PEZI|nr:hypothetical protein BD289DRAFT_280731 [Coniella lustricola]
MVCLTFPNIALTVQANQPSQLIAYMDLVSTSAIDRHVLVSCRPSSHAFFLFFPRKQNGLELPDQHERSWLAGPGKPRLVTDSTQPDLLQSRKQCQTRICNPVIPRTLRNSALQRFKCPNQNKCHGEMRMQKYTRTREIGSQTGSTSGQN